MLYPDGKVYEGGWYSGSQWGFGSCSEKNGNVYRGFWRHGIKSGQGFENYCATDIPDKERGEYYG